MNRIFCIVLMLSADLAIFGCLSTSKIGKYRVETGKWVDLFDGKTMDGWRTYLHDTVTAAWTVEKGVLTFDPTGLSKEQKGSLVTEHEYEDFELQLEWRISEGGNSGIFIGVQESDRHYSVAFTGMEMQILDNIAGKDRDVETHLAGAFYDMYGSRSTSLPKPVGQWNKVRIVQYKNHIQFWLNGVSTAKANLESASWNELVNRRREMYPGFIDFAKRLKGKVALQDHGDVVSFRKIRIRTLSAPSQ